MTQYEFKTKSGVILSTQPFVNGNCIYSTAQAIFLGANRPDYELAMDDFEVKPGLLSRWHDRLENDQVDDHIAACCNPEFARRFLQYGRSHFGFYDCTPGFWPNPAQFLWRFQGLICHAKLSAGEDLGCIGRMIWCKSIDLAAGQPETNHDGWIQSHLMIRVWQKNKRDWGHEIVSRWFNAKHFPTWQIMKNYLALDDHPLIDLWRPYG